MGEGEPQIGSGAIFFATLTSSAESFWDQECVKWRQKSTKTKALISSSATFFATQARRVEVSRECQVKRQKPKTDKKINLQQCNFFAGCPHKWGGGFCLGEKLWNLKLRREYILWNLRFRSRQIPLGISEIQSVSNLWRALCTQKRVFWSSKLSELDQVHLACRTQRWKGRWEWRGRWETVINYEKSDEKVLRSGLVMRTWYILESMLKICI